MMKVQTRCQFAGAEWVAGHTKQQMSPVGIATANLLGQLFQGIYHLPMSLIEHCDWTDEVCTVISVPVNGMASVDFNGLTRLVFLAHAFSMRVQVEGSCFHYMKLRFHQRTRDGNLPCPTLEEAVARFMAREGNDLTIHPMQEDAHD